MLKIHNVFVDARELLVFFDGRGKPISEIVALLYRMEKYYELREELETEGSRHDAAVLYIYDKIKSNQVGCDHIYANDKNVCCILCGKTKGVN